MHIYIPHAVILFIDKFEAVSWENAIECRTFALVATPTVVFAIIFGH